MKDVPTKLPTGCVCAAVGPRDESRDAVIVSAQRKAEGWTRLGDFPAGGTVGTSSVRRAAMVRRRWPHLLIKDVRGNVGTRLMKLDTEAEGFDALVLAGAGVQRLGLGERISSWLGGEEGVLHAVGQGALGVEWREGDEWVGGLVDEVAKAEGAKAWRVRWECVAERGLLRVLEGGCSVPVGVECGWEDSETAADGRDVGKASLNGGRGLEGPRVEGGYEQDAALPEGPKAKSSGGTLVMHSMVVSLDGKKCVEGSRRQYVSSDAEAEECGWEMARELVDNGAGEILKEITLNRGMIRGQDGA